MYFQVINQLINLSVCSTVFKIASCIRVSRCRIQLLFLVKMQRQFQHIQQMLIRLRRRPNRLLQEGNTSSMFKARYTSPQMIPRQIGEVKGSSTVHADYETFVLCVSVYPDEKAETADQLPQQGAGGKQVCLHLECKMKVYCDWKEGEAVFFLCVAHEKVRKLSIHRCFLAFF